ncbi:hypothetical protein C0989_006716 [Termitomyces sp. Mn162]|nr:hypothetical protein C0989_006716 [Termitomyces sp. Mn162]KAH0589532.1 hypothetical protein H2248_005269 [Termitomyces sp. 'cryptogamus']
MSYLSTATALDIDTTSLIYKRRRRLSTPASRPPTKLQLCQQMPLSLEALDLSLASPTQTLASLRFLVLSYLAELEQRLSNFESPDFEVWKAMGELTIEDARQWARTALEMLEGIRADVCSHLPELHFAELSVETFKSHIPDLLDASGLNEVCIHLPEMPHLLDIPDVRTRISNMRHKFDDVRSRFIDLDFKKPLHYIPTLSSRLDNLHSHLASLALPSRFEIATLASSALVSDLLEALSSSELVTDILSASPKEFVEETEDMIHKAANDVANAVKHSLQGVRLLQYSELPEQWQNNPFVTYGYRFIPLEKWPLIFLSLFALHNETLNIHTHLIPFLLWGLNSIPFTNSTSIVDIPERLFMFFALLCLFASAVWHTMSGCADGKSMDLCARIDYVGIGWLISASVGTVVYYGYTCHPGLGQVFLLFCFLTGLAGNVFPFMDWFNRPEYRNLRVLFFLSLAFSAIAPLAGLVVIHSWREMFTYIGPIVPSLASYLIGLAFYVMHFPERILPRRIQHKLDCIGGSSHCIWHCFIVLAVSQHRTAMASLRTGLQCLASP